MNLESETRPEATAASLTRPEYVMDNTLCDGLGPSTLSYNNRNTEDIGGDEEMALHTWNDVAEFIKTKPKILDEFYRAGFYAASDSDFQNPNALDLLVSNVLKGSVYKQPGKTVLVNFAFTGMPFTINPDDPQPFIFLGRLTERPEMPEEPVMNFSEMSFYCPKGAYRGTLINEPRGLQAANSEVEFEITEETPDEITVYIELMPRIA